MPSRKKSSLSQYSRNAKRMRAIRSQESDEDREARLAAARERQATARSLETSAQRESRLCAQRIRTAASRALESSKEREARRTADRERHTLSRALETLTERESRLSSQLVRTAFSRLFESSEEREARRTTDRQRHAESRAFETFTRRKGRLSADRDRHNIARALESEDRYRQRLESARENYERTRQDREDFLLFERERIDETWQMETAEQRQARLRHSLDIISISSQDSDESQEDGAVKYELPWIVKDYVLQPDGSVTPVAKVQNLVLDEQRAGEILSLAQALREQQSKPTASPRTILLSSTPSLPGATSAMLRLQFCSAQAIADGSASTTVRKTKLLPSLLPTEPIRLENGVTTLNLLPDVEHADLGKHTGEEEVLIIHPYECSECNLLFSTPEDFLHHQGEHFLAQDKESGGTGVMLGYEDGARARADEGRKGDAREEGSKAEQGKSQGGRRSYTARLADLGVTSSISSVNLRCEECKRTFTTANRLAAHLRVHEQGTHECPECDKVFKKVGSLHTHMRTHSGEARFLCVDCGHSFTTEMTLIIHRKSHTSEPLHRCPFCAKTFTNMTKFLYHRRTHTNREPVSTASTVPLTQRMPLSIMQRAREREAVWRKQKQAALPAPETDTAESILEAAASLSQAAASVENGVDSKDPTTEDAQANLDLNNLDADVMDDSDEWQAPITEEDIKFPCSTCSKSFTSRIRLLSHRRSAHSSERRFKCNVCGKPFKKQIHLRNHLRTHTGERPFQCSVCGKTFSSLANLTRHGLTHTGVRPYRCDVCHRAFTQSSNLRQHRLLHTNPTPSACPDCSATFIRPSKLVAHRFLNHPGAPAPYSCPHCPKGFLRKKQRDLHCLEEHPNSTHPFTDSVNESGNKGQQASIEGVEQTVTLVQKPNLDCTICGKRLNSMANLRLHQLSHGLGPGRPRGSGSAAGKSHPCPVCGKLFVSASSVTLHQRVHTGERPYPCAVCGKRFRQNTHLREHLRTHSGERPFRCDFCNKGFVQSMHLVEHRRTHTGERPHTCAECGKTFKTISNLRNHRKTHNKAQHETERGTDSDLETTTVEGGLATLAVVDATDGNFCSQPQLIQIQTSDLEQTQGTPTIMCNEFGEAIAIIETSGDLAEAIELYHTALEGGINMDTITLDNLQLL